MDALIDGNVQKMKITPLKFALWASMASILMMFAALMSAYIVRQSQGNWLEFRLPFWFFVSAATMLISSATLQKSYTSFKKEDEKSYKAFLAATFLLGFAFVALQYKAWMSLFAIGIELTGNPSGAFIYVISGLHMAHVIGGMAVLLVALVHAYKLPFRVTQKRLDRFDLTATYWHFVDFLWIVLVLFFVLQS
jgi:cytochrome c oxidase subunit 3